MNKCCKIKMSHERVKELGSLYHTAISDWDNWICCYTGTESSLLLGHAKAMRYKLAQQALKQQEKNMMSFSEVEARAFVNTWGALNRAIPKYQELYIDGWMRVMHQYLDGCKLMV